MSPLKQSFHFADKTVEKFTCSLSGSSASVFTSQWGLEVALIPNLLFCLPGKVLANTR